MLEAGSHLNSKPVELLVLPQPEITGLSDRRLNLPLGKILGLGIDDNIKLREYSPTRTIHGKTGAMHIKQMPSSNMVSRNALLFGVVK